MKTNFSFRFIFAVQFLMLASTFGAQAQMSQHKYGQLFAQAFEEVQLGNYAAAEPMLAKLHKADASHAQVAYLLGLTYVKQGHDLQEAAILLSKASKRYNAAHQHGRVEDTTAPSAVWLVLGEALAATGRSAEAVGAYRTYMTTIPMASIQRKSEVIERIRMAKNADAPSRSNPEGRSQQLAALIP